MLRDDLETAARTIAELGFDGMEVHLSQLGPGMPGVTVYEAHAAAAGGAHPEQRPPGVDAQRRG